MIMCLWASMTFWQEMNIILKTFTLVMITSACQRNVHHQLLIGTPVNDADKEMIKQQNQFLFKKFCNKAFQKDILQPSDQHDDCNWFFCGENSVSDPDSPN